MNTTPSLNRKNLVSVIIIVKNGEKFIKQAIQSVLDQTIEPDEILVIDGHSTDNTEKICKKFPRINFIKQSGKGIPDAYNQGIKTSNCEFVSFISHDDIWEPNKLEKHLKYMVKRPEIKYTISKALFFLEDKSFVPKNFRKELLGKSQVSFIMETLVARKSLFETTGYFDRSFVTGEDTDWFARTFDLKIEHDIIYETLVLKRIHKNNISTNSNKVFKNMLKAVRKSIARKKEDGK